VSRRVRLPGTAELFQVPDGEAAGGTPAEPASEEAEPAGGRSGTAGPRPLGSGPTGRQRHDEKITVYCSADELIAMEHARLTLRRDFGVAVDRGRIVREALSVVLADLEAKGEASILVRRLGGR
jgi:hypothetical protein